MIQFLGSILGPLFAGFGVSEADFQMYLTQLSGYVYGILAALIVMIAVLILAVKVPKGLKHIVRWQAVLAFVALLPCSQTSSATARCTAMSLDS